MMRREKTRPRSRGGGIGRGIDRGQFLAGLAGVPVWIAAGGCSPDAGSTSGEARVAASTGAAIGDRGTGPRAEGETLERRVERILREYDAQGIHRTGTGGDIQSALWLLDEARHLGAAAGLEAMPFSRIDVGEAFVEVAGRRIDGVPLFDSPFTGTEGIAGVLGPTTDPGAAIGWTEAMPDAAGGPDLLAHRRGSDQKALVLVTGGPRWEVPPGLALLNAESYREPYGAPAVQVPTDAKELLDGAAGDEARVVVDAMRTDVEVHNVLARVDGRDPALAPLVVMTPRSGWWQCASERGGGIAVWLEMLAAIAAATPARTVHFVASTGHELGHFGLEHYLQSRRAWIEKAHAWIHLGANFGTSKHPRVLLQVSNPALRGLTIEALGRHGLTPDVERAMGEPPLGEVRNVAGGGRYVSILGRSGVFHHPDDRFLGAVDVPKTIAFARAFAEIGVALAADGAAASSA